MSQMDEPILAVAECLRHLQPPTAVMHVGAGTGTGPVHHWRSWDVKKAWLLDAQESRLEWAQPLRSQHPDWHITKALLGTKSGVSTYHVASNPAESGLLPAEALSAYWPNLHTLDTEERTTATLDELIPSDALANDINWLIIDCCPALAVLEGAKAVVSKIDVIWLRAILDESRADNNGAALAEIEPYLTERGFVRIHVSEANHPKVGMALFTRSVSRQLDQTIAALAAANEDSAKRSDEFAAKLNAKDEELGRTKRECEAHVAQLKDREAKLQELPQLREQLNALNAKNAELTQAVAKQTQESKDREAALTQNVTDLTAAKTNLEKKIEVQTAQLGERTREIEQLKASNTEAANEARANVAKLKEQLDALTARNAELTQASIKQAQEAQDREAALAKNVADLSAAKNNLSKKIDALHVQLTERSQEIDRLKTDNTALERQKTPNFKPCPSCARS